MKQGVATHRVFLLITLRNLKFRCYNLDIKFVKNKGISEIIRIPDQFHPKWNTNFFVSSLAGRNIYRVKFDRNYSRVIFSEKIYIGNRIRDLIYSEKLNIIFLSLEDYGELGVLRSKTIEGN